MVDDGGLPGGEASASHRQQDLPAKAHMLDEEMAGQSELPSPAEQARLVQEYEQNSEVQEGDHMHVISTEWYNQWREYTQQSEDSSSDLTQPGKIDNSSLMDGSPGQLKENLQEGDDFVFVTAKTWDALKQWYGGDEGISRKAFTEGLAPQSKRPRVVLYDMKLEVCTKDKKGVWMEAAKSWTVGELKTAACDMLGVPEADYTLWDFFHHDKYKNLDEDLGQSLDEAKILENQAILLDSKADPLPEKDKSSPGAVVFDSSTPSTRLQGRLTYTDDSTIERSGSPPGVAGLQNLGNTCFMNSSLQCLMHAVPLLKVFLSGAYKEDINTENPLGMKGMLATAFGGLMDKAWQGDVGVVAPRGFKARIAQFAPQFSGYQQHDSQEFLAFLLDGLHEDINRIKQKPYVEEHEADGVPDEQLATEAWSNYRRRNDSAIVDHFQGLYKSTLVCPKCNYTSRKFDPFMYLSLPLPESRVWQMLVILLRMDGKAPPIEYGIEVPQTGTVRDVYVALARAAGLQLTGKVEEVLVLAQLDHSQWSYGLDVYEDPKTRLTDLRSKKGATLVYLYANPEDGPTHEGNKQVIVYHRQQDGGRHNRNVFFSAPLLLWLPEGSAYDPDVHVIDHRPPGSTHTYTSFNFQPHFEVAPRAPIWRHIHRALQPFRTSEPLPEVKAAAAAGQEQEDEDMPDQVHVVPPASIKVKAAAAMAAAAAHETGEAERLKEVVHTPRRARLLSGGDTPMGTIGEGPEEEDEGGDEGGLDALADAAGWGPDDLPMLEDDGVGGHNGYEAIAEAGPGEGFGEGGGLAEVRAASPNGSWGSSNAGSGAAAAGDLEERDDLREFDSILAGDVDIAASGAGDMALFPSSPAPGTPGRTDDITPVKQGGEAKGAGDQGEQLGDGPVVQPFNMWAGQSNTAADAAGASGSNAQAGQEQRASNEFVTASKTAVAEAGEDAEPLQPPYRLWLANEKGHSDFQSWDKKHPQIYHDHFTMDWHTAAMVQVPKAAAAAATHQQSHLQQQRQVEPEEKPREAMDIAGAVADGMEVVESLGGYELEGLKEPQTHETALAQRERLSGPARPVCLEQCVQAFLQPEQLSHEDEWYCPKCKEFVQADKKLDLWGLPEVLVVHLKRFSYTRWHRDKLDTPVTFPLSGLDLTGVQLAQQEGPPPVYDCFAVSNHFGGLGGGHYTAYAQQPDSGKWYCFDDSRVDETSAASVQSPAAYVLFYRRRHEASQDPPDLLQQLLIERQQQQAAAEAAAAAGVAGAGPVPAEVEMDNVPAPPPVPPPLPGRLVGTAAAATAAAAAATAAAKRQEAEQGGDVEMDGEGDGATGEAGASSHAAAAVAPGVDGNGGGSRTCSGDSGPGPAGLKGLAANLPSGGTPEPCSSSKAGAGQADEGGEGGGERGEDTSSSSGSVGGEGLGVGGADSSADSSGASSGRHVPRGSWEGRRGSGSVKHPEQHRVLPNGDGNCHMPSA